MQLTSEWITANAGSGNGTATIAKSGGAAFIRRLVTIATTLLAVATIASVAAAFYVTAARSPRCRPTRRGRA